MLSSWNLSSVFSDAIAEHLAVVGQLENQRPVLERIASRMSSAVAGGRRIFWCGNGGSAADSQHLEDEFVGRFRRDRQAIASVALSADSSVVTAIANDYGYDEIFSRQLEALCRPDDVVVGMSTSGNSPNICLALQTARDLGAFTVALTGDPGGRLAGLADLCIRIASRHTARIQEAHILCGHMLCECVEAVACHEPELALAGSAR